MTLQFDNVNSAAGIERILVLAAGYGGAHLGLHLRVAQRIDGGSAAARASPPEDDVEAFQGDREWPIAPR